MEGKGRDANPAEREAFASDCQLGKRTYWSIQEYETQANKWCWQANQRVAIQERAPVSAGQASVCLGSLPNKFDEELHVM